MSSFDPLDFTLWLRARERGSACAAEADMYRALIAELKALRAKVRTDTERLDWMDRVNRRTNESNGTVYGWRFELNHNRAALTDMHLPALTVREAIDRAMDGKS